jgi:hypothetical protein
MTPDRQLLCDVCGQPFVYAEAEWAKDERLGYPPPRLCSACRQQRNAARAAERAAKRPRRRYFRR